MRIDLFAIHNRFPPRESAVWSVFQQLSLRLIAAAKFFSLAAIAGPTAVGEAVTALAIAAFIDAVSDLGLNASAIQRRDPLSRRQLGAMWTLSLIRGVSISLVLIVLARPISSFLNTPALLLILPFCAVQFAVKGATSTAYHVYPRERNFRTLGIFEVSAGTVDLFATIILGLEGLGALALIIGGLCGDLVRAAISWVYFWRGIAPSFQWRSIGDVTQYGRWIWLTGVLVAFANQVDKLILSKYVGVAELGLYQTMLRAMQLGTTDVTAALSSYFFPVFAAKYHQGKRILAEYYSRMRRRLVWVLLLSLGVEAFLIYALPDSYLPPKWSKASSLIPFIIPQCLVGALLTLHSTLDRARGRASTTAAAICLQIMVLMASALILLPYIGVGGMALASAIAGTVSYLWMLRRSTALNHE